MTAEIKNVVSVEAGYAYFLSARDISPGSPHGLVSSLNYGYVIHEKPKSMTALSLVLGYDLFPKGDGSDALHAMVYGVEYAHTFFRQKAVSLLLDYGLLFNLIRQSDREGYAFGHQTRLSIGGVYNLSEKHKLALKGTYNFVSFPNFQAIRGKDNFPLCSPAVLPVFLVGTATPETQSSHGMERSCSRSDRSYFQLLIYN